MIAILQEIRQLLVESGAAPETLELLDAAIARAEQSETASAQRTAARIGEFRALLEQEVAANADASDQYVADRQRRIAVLEDHFRQLVETGQMEEQEANLNTARMARQAAAADAAAESFNNFMNAQGFNKTLADSFTGKMLIAGPEGFTALAASMADTIDVGNLFASGLAKMESATKELFFSFDKAQAQLSTNTGTTGEYNDMLYETIEQNKSFGVGVDEASEAISNLHNKMSSFSSMGQETQAMLTETTARLQGIGVDAGTAAQGFDNMIQGMGMSADMANNAQLELVALGDSIGVAAGVISKDFNDAAGELAKYGEGAIDVFKGMSAAAKATGIEMSSLMGMAKQFDTFEGAAKSAGKLNAILGGGVVNSMDLLNATEEERIRLLIQAQTQSGKQWSNLNRFEKQAIASAAGISDMAEANKLFSMSLSAYDDMQSKAKGAEAEQAKLQERAQAGADFMEKLKQIGQSFAVAFMPVLDLFHGFANIVLELNDMTGGLFIPTMVGLLGVVYMLTQAQRIANIGTAASAGLHMVTGGAAGSQATATRGLSVAQYMAAQAARQQTQANAMLVTSFASLASALIPLTPAIVSFGLAIAAVAIAIAAPFIALGMIIYSFTELFKAMLEAPKAIAAAVIGLVAFAVAGAAALVILATGIAVAVTVLLPFAAAMITVAPALALFGAAMLLVVLPLVLFGKSLASLAAGIDAFSKVKFKDLGMAAASLLTFAVLLIPVAPILAILGTLVGIPLILLGWGLQKFAESIKAFNKVGLGALAMATVSLGIFAIEMIALAPLMAIIGLLVGLPLILFGMGLAQFGKGIVEFNKVSWWAMTAAAMSLALFTVEMLILAVPLAVIGVLVALPLIMFAAGLGRFAKSLKMFNKIGFGAILKAAFSLGYLAITLIPLAIPFALLGLLVALPLILLSMGLMDFAKSLRRFNKVSWNAIMMAVAGLTFLTFALLPLAIPLAIVGLLVGIPLILLGMGLIDFAKGLKRFNKIGYAEIFKAAFGLALFGGILVAVAPLYAVGLIVAVTLYLLGLGLMQFGDALAAFNAVGWGAMFLAGISLAIFGAILVGVAPLYATGYIVALTLYLLAIGLKDFGEALQEFNNVGFWAMITAGIGLALFGGIIAGIGPMFAIGGMMMGIGLILLSAGLSAFGNALMVFNSVGIGAVLVAVAALTLFGITMGFLIFTGLIGYMIAGFWALTPAMMIFGWALSMVATGLQSIGTSLPLLYTMADSLSILTYIGMVGSWAMWELANSLWDIAFAMSAIPESKALSFGFAMSGYGAAMEAVSKLTPESVEAAGQVVELARQYVEIQAEMKLPDQDAFVSAMQNVFGGGESEGGGQDIVLVLNDREFGKAVDAVIDKKHNLRVD